MSLRRFATQQELAEQLGPVLAQSIWDSAAPAIDSETGVETAVSDPIFAGVYAAAEADLPAEINVTKLITKLDALKAELRKVR